MTKREDIRIRDPFILPDAEKGIYYLYGTTALGAGIAAGNSFSAYTSRDLENFEGPFVVFDGAKAGFWADRDYWAPEVHKRKGKYYLFGSFIAPGRRRGTQILRADFPLGPFQPFTDGPATPADWECLDGTLWEEDGKPYLVFCHEWLQVENGEMCALPLSDDLTPAGEPFLLFRAGDNPEVCPIEGQGDKKCMITDGPFLFREKGKTMMIWSSFAAGGRYAVLEAEADSLKGPWVHKGSRFPFDGGHAMLFEDFSGVRRISLHMPNASPFERAVFLKY